MPPPLPDRYKLEVRLGRDADLEEWLATDTALDRPVLIRILGPESSEERRQAFIRDTRQAAGVNHVHLVSVFSAGRLSDGAYSVMEWAGGVSMADRLMAGETMPADEFLPNAAGLAEALAALHESGGIHGSIDPGAVKFSSAHPAKLGSFGRPHAGGSIAQDVRALAETLETSITGRPPATVGPSQVVDGVSPAVDEALEGARLGRLDGRGLAQAIRATPQGSAPVRPGRSWSWRWLVPAALLAIIAIGIVAIGLVLPPGSDSGVMFPVNPGSTTTTVNLATTVVTTAPPVSPGSTATIVRAFSYDPFGDGSEHDASIPNLTDGDPATVWRTERYFDPLPRLKGGVGVAVEVDGSPAEFEAIGVSDGTTYSILWAESLPAEGIDGWERIASGTATGSRIGTQVPQREGGFWLLWLTDLPVHSDPEGYYSNIAEVRFRS